MKTKLLKIFFVVITIVLSSAEIKPQWEKIIAGTTISLQSVHFADNNSGYIVGESGLILKSADGGLTWQNVSSPGSSTLYDVFVFNQNNVVAVGGSGIILRTTDGGLIWNNIPSGVFDDLFSVSFTGSFGIIGGGSQTILYSTDSGATWNTSQSGFFGGGFWGTIMLDSQSGFVAGQNSIFQPMLGKTTDAGVNWNFTPFYLNNNEGRATGVDFTDVNTGYVSSAVWDGRGSISKTTDSGVNWVTTFSTNILEDVDFPVSGASLIGYSVGQSGTILKTFNAGDTWLPQTSNTLQKLNKVFFLDPDNGFAVGDSGIILKTMNGGIPVELISFNACISGESVMLNWTTASEVNNQGFEIERSQIKNSWEKIGFVKGSGTTTETKYYSFYDNNFSSEKYIYRLKQIDFDGSFEYSNEVEVETGISSAFKLQQNYPNPFNPVTTITWQLPVSSKVIIKVYDMLGQEISKVVNGNFNAGIYNIKFNSANLNSGIYFYSIDAKGIDGSEFNNTRRMLLLK